MKKLIYSFLLLGIVLCLFSFSPINKRSANYTVLTPSQTSLYVTEVGSFEQSEHMKTTSDKGVWSKRYKIWTLTGANIEIEVIEEIIINN